MQADNQVLVILGR